MARTTLIAATLGAEGDTGTGLTTAIRIPRNNGVLGTDTAWLFTWRRGMATTGAGVPGSAGWTAVTGSGGLGAGGQQRAIWNGLISGLPLTDIITWSEAANVGAWAVIVYRHTSGPWVSLAQNSGTGTVPLFPGSIPGGSGVANDMIYLLNAQAQSPDFTSSLDPGYFYGTDFANVNMRIKRGPYDNIAGSPTITAVSAATTWEALRALLPQTDAAGVVAPFVQVAGDFPRRNTRMNPSNAVTVFDISKSHFLKV